jgi:DNA-binding GntR family transcriptional regulator
VRISAVEPYRTKAQLAFEELKRVIAEGELPPGVAVSPRRLAERLGMSLTPVREAIRRLEAGGLVSGLPHSTLRVRDVTPEEVRDVYSVRSVLEGYAAKQAASRLDRGALRQLARYLKGMAAALRGGQLRSYRLLDEAWHMLIYEHASNPLLVGIIQDLWHRYPRDSLLAIPGRAVKSMIAHRRIFQALRKKDEIAAETRMNSHILSSMEDILKYIDHQQPSVAARLMRGAGAAGPRSSREAFPR